MSDKDPVIIPARGDQPQMVDLGTVAAENIALALELDAKHVPAIKQGIKDEINALASHFSLAMRDVQDQFELEVGKVKTAAAAEVEQIKSTYKFVSANVWALIGVAAAVFAFGFVVGHFA